MWFKEVDELRGLYTMINIMRANHYNLNESLARKEHVINNRCGIETQDLHYVIFRCSLYDETRYKLFRDLNNLNQEYPYNLHRWIKYTIVPPLKAIWKFFREIGKII